MSHTDKGLGCRVFQAKGRAGPKALRQEGACHF